MYVYFQFKTQVGGISKSASFFICSRFQFLYKYIALIMYTWCQHVCECLTLQRPSLLAFREHSQQVYKLTVTPTCDSCRSFFLNVNCKKFLFYKNENDCNYKLPNTLTFLTHLLQLHCHSLSWFSITYNLSSKKLVWHVNQSVSCPWNFFSADYLHSCNLLLLLQQSVGIELKKWSWNAFFEAWFFLPLNF